MKTLIILSFSIFISLACSDNSTNPYPSGSYTYRAFDSAENQIVTGWMTINFDLENNIRGEWHFTSIGNPQNIGPHTGNGQLEGSRDNGVIWINLNPDWADNNVFLKDTVDNEIFSGHWEYAGFAGIINSGTFTTTRN